MATSTLTDKGQTTVPQEIRKALRIKARQQLDWTISDGVAVVRPRLSARRLLGSLPSKVRYQSRDAERQTVMRAVGEHVIGN